jgi:hypothetical protein
VSDGLNDGYSEEGGALFRKHLEDAGIYLVVDSWYQNHVDYDLHKYIESNEKMDGSGR